MKINPNSPAFVMLLAAMTALGALATDLYLPSLPAIQIAYDVEVGPAQLTLSAFLIGSAVSQLIYGPLSDRFGRYWVLLSGLALFVVSTLACVWTHSIDQMIVARFIQALGAGASIVISRAIVRDHFEGHKAGAILGQMGMLMGVVPAMAPTFGGIIQQAVGWQGNFYAMAAIGLALLIVVALCTSESLPLSHRQSIAPMAMLRNYGTLLADKRYVRCLMIIGFCFSGLFAFISGSSFVLQEMFHLSPFAYGMNFAMMVVGFVSGSLFGSRAHQRFGLGLETLLTIGGSTCLIGGALMVLFMFAGLNTPFAIVGPMALYSFGVGLNLPQAMAGGMLPFPRMAGSASALLGFLQMTAGAVAGAFVGEALDGGTATPMIYTIAAMGACTFCVIMARPLFGTPQPAHDTQV